MQGILNLTQQYLPELEKFAKSSKPSFNFRDKVFSKEDQKKKKVKEKKRKKRKKVIKRDSAHKIAKTVFNSMQAHVNRIRIDNIVNSTQSVFKDRSKIIIPAMPKLELKKNTEKPLEAKPVPKKIAKKVAAESKMKCVSAKGPENRKTKKGGPTAKKSKSVANRLKKSTVGGEKNKQAKKAVTKTRVELRNKNLELKRDQFLSCLKNLQEELSALKIPDFTVPQKDKIQMKVKTNTLQKKTAPKVSKTKTKKTKATKNISKEIRTHPAKQNSKLVKSKNPKVFKNKESPLKRDNSMSTYLSSDAAFDASQETLLEKPAFQFNTTKEFSTHRGPNFPTINRTTGVRLEMNLKPFNKKQTTNIYQWSSSPLKV